MPLTPYVAEEIVRECLRSARKADERIDRNLARSQTKVVPDAFERGRKIAMLDPAQRRKVEDRAAEFIVEEMSLRQLRRPGS